MKKLLIAILIAGFCGFGCTDGGNVDLTVDTGGAESSSENKSDSSIINPDLADLIPALVCSECDLAQMEATGRMFDILAALVNGQRVLPDGQQVDTPLAQPQITIAIDAYSSAVNEMQEGASTMTTEADFQDTIDDLLDDTDTVENLPSGEVA